jgi:drug/metabolite transporter (DMT)-like permease
LCFRERFSIAELQLGVLQSLDRPEPALQTAEKLSSAISFVSGPASASLTFLANALVTRVYLKERVDRRRWLAAIFVAAGVALPLYRRFRQAALGFIEASG